MTIEASPILPDIKNLVQRIGEDKQTENYILIEPSEARTMSLPYDARADTWYAWCDAVRELQELYRKERKF